MSKAKTRPSLDTVRRNLFTGGITKRDREVLLEILDAYIEKQAYLDQWAKSVFNKCGYYMSDDYGSWIRCDNPSVTTTTGRKKRCLDHRGK